MNHDYEPTETHTQPDSRKPVEFSAEALEDRADEAPHLVREPMKPFVQEESK